MDSAEQHAVLRLVDTLLSEAGKRLDEVKAAREVGFARGENAKPRWAVTWLAELRLLQQAVRTEIAVLAPEEGPQKPDRPTRKKASAKSAPKRVRKLAEVLPIGKKPKGK